MLTLLAAPAPRATTARAIAREGITEVFFIRHQFGTPGIKGTLHKDEGGGVQPKRDGVVH